MLCLFLLYNKVNQLYVDMYPPDLPAVFDALDLSCLDKFLFLDFGDTAISWVSPSLVAAASE